MPTVFKGFRQIPKNIEVVLARNSLVIIPTHNEAGNLQPLVQQVLSTYPSTHVLFVDDCSEDGAREEIQALREAFPARVFALLRPAKLGIGSAYREGMLWALESGYSWILQMDGDGSHDPAALALLLEGLDRCPIVIGSRRIAGGTYAGMSFGRRSLSHLSSSWARFWLGLPIRDLTSGFNGWHASLLRELDLGRFSSKRFGFQIELKCRALAHAQHFLEVPIRFRTRGHGVSKLGIDDILDGLRLVHQLAHEHRI